MTHNSALQPVLSVPTAGYLFTYYNSKLSKEREAQIDRVNAQVGRGLTVSIQNPKRRLQHAPAAAQPLQMCLSVWPHTLHQGATLTMRRCIVPPVCPGLQPQKCPRSRQ
jgi:hypothetical protein